MPDQTASVNPLLSNPSTFEKTLMWQEQFMKGIAHGFTTQEWALVTQVAVKAAKTIASLDLEKVEGINEAHQKGYELVQIIRREIYKFPFGIAGPGDK